ncbi:hypothetical protein CPter291_3039 [Collimonas pratensis]|uniref:Uncharacterized protein n=1 Tax=Collimonas pratensis TaxID=279113 RepID=A0ABM5Z8X9_9BURK|nr:hypothetical protein CPter291_3039 [Collimonas pratensis]
MNGGIEIAMFDFEFYNAAKDFFSIDHGQILALENVNMWKHLENHSCV